MLNSQSLSANSKISETINKSDSPQVRRKYLMCNYTKYQSRIPIVFQNVLNFPRVSMFLANFTIVIIGKEKIHLLTCVKLYRKFINIHAEKKHFYFLTENCRQKP